MQTIWGRASQARTTCRCPSCSFQHRSLPRRRTTTSIAQQICSSTTGFAVSFSTAVAGASYFDAKSKQKRRAVLNDGIAQAQAEVQALREDQDARLRALGRDPAAMPQVYVDGVKAHDNTLQSASIQGPYLKVHPVSSDSRVQTGDRGSVLSPRLSDKSSLSKDSTSSTWGNSLNEGSDAGAWSKRSYDSLGQRDVFIMEAVVSRLILQLELLTTHLNEQQADPSPRSAEVCQSERAHDAKFHLRELDILYKRLRESVWHQSWNQDETDSRILEAYSNTQFGSALRVHYDRAQSRDLQSVGNAQQEDMLLELFSSPSSAPQLLSALSQLLSKNKFAPSIHAFNIMIIGLCDHGLPAAARLVLECLRRSPLEANAVTHEAAVRCSLLDRDERFFVAYYEDMKCKNRLGWHYGRKAGTGEAAFAYRHSKRLHRGFKSKVYGVSCATTTQYGTEAIIRAFLRSKRLQSALREYHRFRDAGGIPSMHLLEAFLRYSFFTRNLQLGRSAWNQIQQTFVKPTSSAYYWMLGLLASSLHHGTPHSVRVKEEEDRTREFDIIAEELIKDYDVRYPLKREHFRSLGIRRKDLFRIAEEVEDLVNPQWLPERSRASFPDLLNAQEHFHKNSSRTRPTNLGSYVQSQHWLMKKLAPFRGPIHTTTKLEDFFVLLSAHTVTTDINYRPSRSNMAAEINAQIPAKSIEIQEPSLGPLVDEEWEDIDENVDPAPLLPPVPSPAQIPAILQWPVPVHSLPSRLTRPYPLPPSRYGQSERAHAT